jgi:MYXO-CTERM domain-containing protein
MKRASVILAAVAGAAMASAASATIVVDTGFMTPGPAVPDNSTAGVIVPLVVASDPINGDTVSNVTLGLIVSHTWQGDVVINLRSAAGSVLNLINRPGNSANGTFGWSTDNFGNPTTQTLMTFTDSASMAYALPVVSGVNNINNPVGTWLPAAGTGNAFQASGGVLLTLGTLANFAAFNGQNAVGTWQLEVFDGAGGDLGNVRQVVLSVTTVPTPGAMALLGLGGLIAARRRRG